MSRVPQATVSPVHFACGHCGVTLSVPAELAGVRGPCPGCGWTIQAPVPAPAWQESTVASPAFEATPKLLRGREEPEPIGVQGSSSPADGPLGRWAFAALGGLVGGVAVFGSVWMWQLGRDLRASEIRPAPAGTAAEDPTLEVLAEQRREAGRETAALLAAQQTVWRFLRSRSPAEALKWLDTPTAEPELVAKVIISSHLEQGLRLEKKRRLPEGAGYLSTWRVGQDAQDGLLIQVNDCSGTPRIDWAALRGQIEIMPAEVATSTTPEK